MLPFNSFRFIPRNGIGGSYGCSISGFLRKLHIIIYSWPYFRQSVLHTVVSNPSSLTGKLKRGTWSSGISSHSGYMSGLSLFWPWSPSGPNLLQSCSLFPVFPQIVTRLPPPFINFFKPSSLFPLALCSTATFL